MELILDRLLVSIIVDPNEADTFELDALVEIVCESDEDVDRALEAASGAIEAAAE